jgi:hypothetical protein
MIRAEYIRFLQTLSIDDDSANVRKMANLVLQNLEILIPLSTAQGQRIKKMVLLAQESWHSLNSDIQVIQEQKTEKTCQISRLKSLSVGPFRGFAKQEDFDLSSQFVLIYGPNGTGKSSFCEALEYGLLGTVTEAENKRFRTQDYLKNAHTKRFADPILVGVDGQGKDLPISSNEALYRFCFVEKNRIDKFSRIAAQTPAKQIDLISTLFGMDAFTDFVGDFTETMDKYIDLEGAKTKELEKKRTTLSGCQQQLKDTIPQQIKAIETDEQALATAYNEGCLFSKMVEDLHGSEETDGLIKQLEEELQKQLPTKSNLTVTRLATLKESIEVAIEDRNEKQTELSRASQKVSFKQLYEAVTQLRESDLSQCPACQTPLSQVTVNPFVHAETALKTLQHLSQLQEAVKVRNSTLDTLVSQLSAIIESCCAFFSAENLLLTVPDLAETTDPIKYWDFLHQKSADGFTPWQHLEAQVKQLEGVDKDIEKATTEKPEKQIKLTKLKEFPTKILKLQTRREVANKSRNDAEEAIKNFDTENAQLIKDVEAEKATVTQNQVITNAYAVFVQSINDYKNSLPSKLVADLGETVLQLYNAFNRNDAEHEKLARIILPLSQNKRLQISFKRAPEDFHDALHVLSEGHIRNRSSNRILPPG